MSMILVVPEDGNVAEQELQYTKVKRGTNILLTLNFYKDVFRVYPWNLKNPVQFNVRAKKLKELSTYVFDKNKDSVDISLASAEDGIVTVVLNSTDEAAVITGDRAGFTGQAGDKLKVIIDDITYDSIDVGSCTSVAQVAAAINAAVGVTVATLVSSYYGNALCITSPTTGENSNVTIDDGSESVRSVVGDLFAETVREGVGRYGDLSIAQSMYFEVEFQPNGSSRVYKTADGIIDVVEAVES